MRADSPVKFGLIGKDIDHSFSPQYFRDKFLELGLDSYAYDLFPLENLHSLKEVLNGLSGFNVTIPYKTKILDFLDEVTPEASRIGAVNCVQITDGCWIGHNTDYYGFRESLKSFIKDESLKALILGQGGSAKAVKTVLEDLHIDHLPISRKPPYTTYGEIDQKTMNDHRLIINTTPLGMHPDVHTCPDIPYQWLSQEHFLFDLVYNPKKTLFLKRGERAGSSIKNGQEMLVLQAEKSWKIWTHKLEI